MDQPKETNDETRERRLTCPAMEHCWKTMAFCVRVPVLSLKMYSICPRLEEEEESRTQDSLGLEGKEEVETHSSERFQLLANVLVSDFLYQISSSQ